MTTLTPEEIHRALDENARAPYGTARNTHAEALGAAAEATGDRELFRRALVGMIEAYEYSAERTKMVVPFARLLQEYDRDPGSFGAHEVHRLFWRFKWVAGRIVESPEIPLTAVDGWLTDMERRYRLAGYSERAVRQAEFHLADATGDQARMERAIAGWAAAERDTMSDCHACETNTQGWYWARKGDDAKAIEVWEPVLSGGRSCMEEPHRVLALSLLPLVRLGRGDEARSYHLRGYRMVRGKESLLRSVGEHIEFCALTGNESRGLEILAEHAAHLGPLADVESQMEFAGGVLVLLRRLTDLGHGDGPTVSHQGTNRTVKELYELLYAEATGIAARFDARNGTALVSRRLVDRIGQQPLVAALPLGVRSAELPSASAARPTAARGTGEDGTDAEFTALLDRARAARQQGHPSTEALWARVARLAETGQGGADGADLSDPALAGDLLAHRAATAARTGDPAARALYAEAAASYRAAGQHSRAAHAQLGVAGSAAQFDAEPDEVRELLGAAARAAQALDENDPERLRRLVGSELTTLRIESYLRERATDGPASPVDTRLVAELEGLVAAYGDETAALTAGPGSAADLLADAELMLAKLALAVDDLDRAAPLLTSAARRLLAAEQPWDAVEPLSLQASVLAARGQLDDAESTARTALAHAAELTEGADQAGVRLTLADILLRRGDHAEEAALLALDATHWLDEAGLAATAGARARLLLARAYAAAERTAEATEVLQSALPDLVEHGEGEGVQARELLGGLLRELHDPRAAAEQYLLAAETAKRWDDPRFEAGLAHSAAEALADGGLHAEAEAAYGRSLERWRRAGGNPVAEARVLRSLAWLAAEDEESGDGFTRARALMEEALSVVDDSDEAGMRYERAQTWQQLARLLQDELEDEDEDEGEGEDEGEEGRPSPEGRATREQMVLLLDQAAALYAEFGADALHERFQCVAYAAWTEQELGRTESGIARLTTLVTELGTLEGPAAADITTRAESLLEQLR
ncbi:tetratricopeptide repeat protein [Streptomyces vilmorinianum]|uniref:tetratricopeptide repeat protein n=1 Tax=Streptomyces vilmorinianum TaxID=3051092 RepID=UPI0010FAFECF|nr:tetratricopeptide repeat protein [Streptomyces vilmorinianum]